MKALFSIGLGSGLCWLTGCLPDDVDDAVVVDSQDSGQDTEASTDDTGSEEDPSLEGRWRSEGADLAPLLVEYFGFNQVDAHFKESGSYVVNAAADDGKTYDYAGTYVVSGAGPIHGIVLNQTSPSTATAQGIFRVTADTLTYEVVQTQPDFGFTAPTPSTGFGSTQGDGIEPDANTQVYRRL